MQFSYLFLVLLLFLVIESEKAVVIWDLLATLAARERRLRRADLLTWSRRAGPNQRMRSRRSLTKETIR